MSANALADELDDVLEVQLLGERRTDLVDDGQLRVALPRLFDGTSPHQRGPDVLRDEHEQFQVLARVAAILAIGLDGDDPDRPAIGLQRRAHPFDGHLPDDLELALLGEGLVVLRGKEFRLAMSQHIGSRSTCLADAEVVPRVRIGDFGVNLIAVEREVDQLTLVVVQRDVEVVRVHQLADDLVDLGVERGHILGGARRLGDAVQGGLDLRGVLVRSLAGFELRDLLVGGSQLVRRGLGRRGL